MSWNLPDLYLVEISLSMKKTETLTPILGLFD